MRLRHLASHSTNCRPRHWLTRLQPGAKTEALGENPWDVQDELLVDIVADSLAEAKAKTLGHTVVDVKAVTLNDRVTDMLAGMLTETEAAILCRAGRCGGKALV